jgi:starch synthase (maltosyl-transferring)
MPITQVSPTVLGGRRPAAAAVGELIPIRATCLREGHDALGAHAVLIDPQGNEHTRVRMAPIPDGLDTWQGLVRPDAIGHWQFVIESWSDPWATWLHRAQVKIPAGIDVEVELLEGAAVLARAAALCGDPATAELLRQAVATVRTGGLPVPVRLAAATDARVLDAMNAWPLREFTTSSGPWPLLVQRRRALVGAWYEFFPRSEGAQSDPPRSGTFATAAERLPAIAQMGFDVIYLPPIHPIGSSHRKGANNALVAATDDPGSPWAIGNTDGGHDAVHPDLGTLADFDTFVARAKSCGLEVALDLALQASPDHPWVRSHPQWFTTRADGTIAYAENPPKKYQDIYPLNFDNDPEGLYREIERVVRHWMDHGVRIFRVDNPHTKPLWVWEQLINAINTTDPDVLFLAEAFTRPPMMQALAQVGFQQSYTYFTWRNGRHELEEYCRELAGPAAAYMRPNFFANTPDILNDYLQHGGPAAFAIRATLAATLAPTYGIYSGFELYEHVALRPGSEEYLDSEKYQYRPRDWEAARRQGRTLAPYLTLLNTVRREHPALQDLRSLHFHQSDNPAILAFAKRDGDDCVLVVCTVDPHREQEATIWWDMPALGLDWSDRFIARDLVTGTAWTWAHGTYVRLRPWEHVAHIVQLTVPEETRS